MGRQTEPTASRKTLQGSAFTKKKKSSRCRANGDIIQVFIQETVSFQTCLLSPAFPPKSPRKEYDPG